MKFEEHIKSFVRRYSHMSTGQKGAIERFWPFYGLEPQKGLLDFNSLFGREALTELEIGFGNGDTLITLAQRYPQKNFLGVDVHKPGVGALLLKIEKYKLTNVRIFCSDAIEVLRYCIPEQSLSAIYLLFPDPWPKRKHHKRRIVQPFFVDLVVQKLISGGKFHLATDWENYALHMKNVVSSNVQLKLNDPTTNQLDRPLTKFENRGKKLGHGVWDFIFTCNNSPHLLGEDCYQVMG